MSNLPETITLTNATWRLTIRRGVYYADSRSRGNPQGNRLSLGTRDRSEALDRLRQFDAALVNGPRSATLPDNAGNVRLPLADGRRAFEQELSGKYTRTVRPTSRARYKAVLDKFCNYLSGKGIADWSQVNDHVLDEYLGHLREDGYHRRTIYTEGTVIKQVVKRLIVLKRLPTSASLTLPIPRPSGTETFCPTPADLQAVLETCWSQTRWHWVGHAIHGLALTGTRISELVALQWRDVEFEGDLPIRLHIRDESSASVAGRESRTTKNGESRIIPVHADLLGYLSERRGHPKSPVFLSATGRKIDDDKLRKALIKVLRHLNSQGRTDLSDRITELTPHGLRHFFISEAATIRDLTETSLMKVVGHRDSKLVRHYFHSRDAKIAEAINMIEIVPRQPGRSR